MTNRQPMNQQPSGCVCRKGGWNPRCPVHPPQASGQVPTHVITDELAAVDPDSPLGEFLFGNEPASSIGERELEERDL